MLLAKLTCIQETRNTRKLDTIPIECLVKWTRVLTSIPLLKLITLSPGSCQNVHPTSGNPISADIGPENILNRFLNSCIPYDQCLVPSSTVNEVLISFIGIKLRAIDSVWMRVVWSVGLFKFKQFFSLNFVVDSYNRLTPASNQLCPIPIEIKAVKLLINDWRVIFHSAETFPWVEMPILNFTICIGSG